MKKLFTPIIIISVLLSSNLFAKSITLVPNTANSCLTQEGKRIKYHEANFENCNLGDSDIPRLIELFEKSDVYTMNLKNNNIETAGAIQLDNYIRNYKKTRWHFNLYLAHNKVGNEAASAFATNPYLDALDISYNPIDNQVINDLVSKIKIGKLSIEGYRITPSSLSALINNNNEFLYYLDLCGCHIGDAGVEEIAKSHSIYDLYIANNDISVNGLTVLSRNARLQDLNISENNMGDEGAIAISASKNITRIVANNNHVGKNGISAFVANKHISALYLQNNAIDDDMLSVFSNNDHIINLDLSNNQITDLGVKILSTNPIVSLYIATNQVGDDGAIALSLNSTLQYLDVSNNKIESDGLNALARNKNLVYLKTKGNVV